MFQICSNFQTSKRRYFVLRTLSTLGKPRLEYYENEKKFRSNGPPKRTIYLSSCFNIARKDDTKHKFVFALYTREDVFGLICESQEELDSWLNALLNEQKNSEIFSENGEFIFYFSGSLCLYLYLTILIYFFEFVQSGLWNVY